MRIAIAGKGGTGKTTLAGTLARTLAADGDRVWAIDADTNPNLLNILGGSEATARPMTGLPRDLLERTDDGEVRLTVPAAELVDRFGQTVARDIGVLVMGRVDHAGSG